MEGIILRDAEPNEKDCSGILALIQELADYENASDQVEMTVQRLIESMKAGHFKGLIAVEGDNVVGMALWMVQYFADGRKALYMEDLYIKQTHRRRGLGEAMVRQLQEEAKKLPGVDSLSWSVLPWNELAINFYKKKLGAEILTDWHLKRISNIASD